MTNTKIALATKSFITSNAQFCTHALTLQMNLHTCNASAVTMERLLERGMRTTRQFIRRLAVAAYGNGAIRKPHLYYPLFITVIEGTLNTYDKNRTLHTHAVIGNILTPFSKIKTEEQLIETIRECWLATDDGVDDIDIQAVSSTGWISYITKELDRGNMECVDWTNSYIPNAALLN